MRPSVVGSPPVRLTNQEPPSWASYCQKSSGRLPRPLFLRALEEHQSTSRTALDIGCGSGIETSALLDLGFQVHAIDQERAVIENLLARHSHANLTAEVAPLESVRTFPPSGFICALQVFPFLKPEHFERVLDRVLEAVDLDGICVGTFMGLEDDWVVSQEVTGVGEEALLKKFGGFDICHFAVTKRVGPTLMNGNKYWHQIDIIAKRFSFLS